MSAKEENTESVKIRGGRLSLCTGIILLLLAAALGAWQFYQPPQFDQLRSLVVQYTSFLSGTLSTAILTLVLAIVVLTSRSGRPFNYIYFPFAIVFYYTVLCLVHGATGNGEPGILMDRIDSARSGLIVVLAILEVLVFLIVGIINKSLNAVYRRHKAARIALKERRNEARAEAGTAEARPSREERKRLKAEARAAKASKNEQPEDKDVVVNVNASSKASVTLDPDSPLSFPETIRVPEFETIPHTKEHVIASAGEEKKVQEHIYVPSGNVVSMSVLENSARNIERKMEEEKARTAKASGKHSFRKGGMLESAIEATINQPQQDQRTVNSSPIIGYTDRRKAAPAPSSASFAPSNLSPSHPRYKLFESLKRKNDEAHAQSMQSTDVTHFPSRTFTPGDEPAAQEENTPVISLKETPAGQTVPSQSPSVPEPPAAKPVRQSTVSTRSAHAAGKPAADAAEAPAPVQEEPQVHPRSEVKPATEAVKPAVEAVKPAADEFIGQEESIMDEDDAAPNDSQIEFKVGVSGLTSNNAGESAIIKRQRRSYTPPSPDFLKDFPQTSYEVGETEQAVGNLIASVMHDFRVEVELADIVKGPTVTLYEYTLAPGVLVSKVENLEKNIAMRIGGQKIRILAPVPGKSAVGIEVPNAVRATVGFKEMLKPLEDSHLAVPMILGRDITGSPRLLDVAKCPHLLIAGTTGSGKSVCINGLVASILYTKSPKEVRLIMVDPKVVELNVYNGIPHLLTPVITEPKRVLKMLSWLVEEMERRYKVFSQLGVRNIENFNSRIREFGYATEKMPYIVLIMDEFADLMTVIGKDIEDYVRRLMAKARAAGIHVVMATQRPSAEVVTGTIKNNIPTRIAFTASSAMNSRIILDESGAENLLGKGDMLLSSQSSTMLTRIQGAFLSEDEVDRIVSYVKTQGEPDYLDESIFEDEPEPEPADSADEDFEGSDADLYEKAKQICFERKGASASYLQRRLSIGYNRAARLVEQMEEEGIVGPANGSKPREILRYE